FQVEPNTEDQHVRVRFSVFEGDNTVRIHLRDDFGLDFANSLPALGAPSRALKVISQSWSAERNLLTLQLAGVAGQYYDLAVRHPGQIASVDGAEVVKLAGGLGVLRVSFPATIRSEYENSIVIVHLVSIAPSGMTGR
ncbi:MAG TPA: hypothetical protein VI424_19210, partial [Terriglobales bacterium]